MLVVIFYAKIKKYQKGKIKHKTNIKEAQKTVIKIDMANGQVKFLIFFLVYVIIFK